MHLDIGNIYIGDSSNNRIRKVVTVTTDMPTPAPTAVPTIPPTIPPTNAPDTNRYAWDLTDNYTITANPNGQWTYGYMSGSVFNAYSAAYSGSEGSAYWYENGGSQMWKSNFTQYVCGIYPGQVSFSCDSGTPAVKWTAPTSHQYFISLIVEKVGLKV